MTRKIAARMFLILLFVGSFFTNGIHDVRHSFGVILVIVAIAFLVFIIVLWALVELCAAAFDFDD